jgi:hypothetical protein
MHSETVKCVRVCWRRDLYVSIPWFLVSSSPKEKKDENDSQTQPQESMHLQEEYQFGALYISILPIRYNFRIVYT